MTDDLHSMRRIDEWFPELATLPAGVFVVGGAVRDALLGTEPLDVDLTARDVRAVARAFAARHGSHIIELGREPMQVLRVVVGGRVYDFVEMTRGSIEEDLLRRDFTMNAMAVETGAHRLIDPTGGASDVETKLVRMVSEQNLKDDLLRIVKAVRMAVKYNFEIDRETLTAMQRNAGGIAEVAVERVTYELRAILSGSGAARGVELLARGGIDQPIFGRALTEQDAERMRAAASPDPDVALALLLEDRSEQEVRELGRRWRLSIASVDSILAMHRLGRQVRDEPSAVAVALFDSGREASERGVAFLRGVGDRESASLLEEVLKRDGERIFLLVPLLTGEEIAEATGLTPGPELGRVKRLMIEAQIRGEIVSREDAVGWAGRVVSSEL